MDWSDLPVPIRVISLDRSVRRRALMTAQFQERRMTWEFSSAVDAQSTAAFYDAHRFDGVASAPVVTLRPRPVSDAEIACTLSHLRAIEAARLDGLEQVIIMEDDVLFGALLASELATILKAIPSDAAYAQLIVSGPAPVKLLGEWGRRSGSLFARKAHRPPIAFADPELAGSNCHAAAAYVVTRPGMDAISSCFDKAGRIVFPCSMAERECNVGLVADRFVFEMATRKGAHGYACARPSFMLEAVDSLLHADHVPSHQATMLEANRQRRLWSDWDFRAHSKA